MSAGTRADASRLFHITLKKGKENGVNILKLIDEGPFQMGTIRDPIAKGTEGAQQLGPERARVYSDLSPEDKDRYNANIRATNILLQGLPKDIYTPINHYTEAKDIWDNVKMLLEDRDRDSSGMVMYIDSASTDKELGEEDEEQENVKEKMVELDQEPDGTDL
ncbi:hypothetical protein Tco_0576372 [Tanacetum coccineum]